MRRMDRKIQNRGEIIDVLRRCDTVRLGINGEPFPYVVPVSFGFEDTGGGLEIYFHGAAQGFKHDLLDKNNRVCVEADIFHKYTETANGGVTALYESFIGFGTAGVVTGDEAAKGMDLILAHCRYEGFVYDKNALKMMRIYKIVLSEMTGKRNIT